MVSKIDPKKFWEEKILRWEKDRYNNDTSSSFLEFFANKASNSILRRSQLAHEILCHNVSGKHILELGCGSGGLAESLIQAGAISYKGIDITESAINAANERIKNNGLQNKVTFSVNALNNVDRHDVDIVFSLGLIDWLTDDEIKLLFSKFEGIAFLHSISEKRRSTAQYMHRFYCYIAYGYKTGGYMPRYFTIDQIKKLNDIPSMKHLNIIRDPKMAFGTFLTSFSNGILVSKNV